MGFRKIARKINGFTMTDGPNNACVTQAADGYNLEVKGYFTMAELEDMFDAIKNL